MEPVARVQSALDSLGLRATVQRFTSSTATAEEAAAAVGCEPGQIIKTLLFVAGERPTIVLVAGDRHADTAMLAQLLGVSRKQLKMATPSAVLDITGFAVGGVAPVSLRMPCDIVVDDSLRRFETAWAAAGEHDAVFGVELNALVSAIKGQWATITRAPHGD